jgi:hypothetical protein
MEDTDLNWRKSSHSGNGGSDCVKVGDRVLVRDTKNRTGLVPTITPGLGAGSPTKSSAR